MHIILYFNRYGWTYLGSHNLSTSAWGRCAEAEKLALEHTTQQQHTLLMSGEYTETTVSTSTLGKRRVTGEDPWSARCATVLTKFSRSREASPSLLTEPVILANAGKSL